VHAAGVGLVWVSRSRSWCVTLSGWACRCGLGGFDRPAVMAATSSGVCHRPRAARAAVGLVALEHVLGAKDQHRCRHDGDVVVVGRGRSACPGPGGAREAPHWRCPPRWQPSPMTRRLEVVDQIDPRPVELGGHVGFGDRQAAHRVGRCRPSGPVVYPTRGLRKVSGLAPASLGAPLPELNLRSSEADALVAVRWRGIEQHAAWPA